LVQLKLLRWFAPCDPPAFPAHKMRGWNKLFRKPGVFLVA
jgi:hypothetical protein